MSWVVLTHFQSLVPILKTLSQNEIIQLKSIIFVLAKIYFVACRIPNCLFSTVACLIIWFACILTSCSFIKMFDGDNPNPFQHSSQVLRFQCSCEITESKYPPDTFSYPHLLVCRWNHLELLPAIWKSVTEKRWSFVLLALLKNNFSVLRGTSPQQLRN